MRRVVVWTVVAAAALSLMPPRLRADGGADGDVALVRSGTMVAWTSVAPVGTCACGRSIYPVEVADRNFRVEIWYRGTKRFDGCLECLLAAVDSGSRR